MAEQKQRGAAGEGSIYQRGNGRWVANVSLGKESDGKRKRVTFYGADRQAVHELMTECIHKHHQGTVIPTGKNTVGEFLDSWLEESVKPTGKAKTYESYEWAVRKHLNPGLGSVPLRKLDSKRVQRFLNQLAVKNSTGKRKKLSAATVANIRAVLRVAFNVAVEDWGLIPRNPANHMKIAKVTPRKVEPLTTDERQALIKAIENERLAAMFMVLLFCGLRKGEVAGLAWGDVDLETRKMHVTRQLQRVNHKLALDSLKTEKSQRVLTIPERVISYLRKHRMEQLEDRLKAGPVWEDTGFVFTTAVGTPVEPRRINTVFTRLLKNAGLPHRTVHDLRHEFGSNLLASGADIKIISDSMGHSNIATTANIYVVASRDLIGEAMDRAASR